MLFVTAAFVVLLIAGLYMEELTWAQVGVCLLGAALVLGLFCLCHWSLLVYMAVLVIADIALVFTVFKGDLRIG